MKYKVVYWDESIWCTQKAMAQLFDVGVPAISKHLKNIFETGELIEYSVISKMEKTTKLGNLQIRERWHTKIDIRNLSSI